MYVIHLLSSIIVGILLRPKEIEPFHANIPIHGEPILSAIKTSIYEGGKTAVTVCIYVLFFSLLTGCITQILPFPQGALIAFSGVLEITSGLQLLTTASLPFRMTFAVSAFLLGFGGCCVLMQSISFLAPAGLSCKKMLIGKGMQSIISGLIAYIVNPAPEVMSPCMRTDLSSAVSSSHCLILLFAFAAILILKITSGKKRNNHI